MSSRSSLLIAMAARARMVEMNRASMSIEVMARTSLCFPAASFGSALHQHASGHLRHLVVVVEVRHFLAHQLYGFEASPASRAAKFIELDQFVVFSHRCIPQRAHEC